MDSQQTRRGLRRKLVTTADDLMARLFSGERPRLQKTQLNHLISICGEAGCAEEIESYLRYQAGRGADRTGWSLELADRVIAGATDAMGEVRDDQERAEAWRMFAVYLARAFTYQDAVAREKARGAAPRHTGQPGRDRR